LCGAAVWDCPGKGIKKPPGGGSLDLPAFIGTLCERAAEDSGINGIPAILGAAWFRRFFALFNFCVAFFIVRLIPFKALCASIATCKQGCQ